MRRLSRPIQAYILFVSLSGAAMRIMALPQSLNNSQWVLRATLIVSGILAGMYSLPMVYGRLRIDLSGSVLLMAVFLDEPGLAILVTSVVSIVAGLALRRRR